MSKIYLYDGKTYTEEIIKNLTILTVDIQIIQYLYIIIK
jgi:hypothetical protein